MLVEPPSLFIALLIFLQLDAHMSRSPTGFDIIGRYIDTTFDNNNTLINLDYSVLSQY